MEERSQPRDQNVVRSVPFGSPRSSVVPERGDRRAPGRGDRRSGRGRRRTDVASPTSGAGFVDGAGTLDEWSADDWSLDGAGDDCDDCDGGSGWGRSGPDWAGPGTDDGLGSVRAGRRPGGDGLEELFADLAALDGASAPRAPTRAARRSDGGTAATSAADRAFLLRIYRDLVGGLDGPVVPFPVELVAGEEEAPELAELATVVDLAARRQQRSSAPGPSAPTA